MRGAEAEALRELSVRADKLAHEDEFSGAILVARDGRVLFSHAYGLADRERQIPNTLRTRFRIGSMNKMFTAVAILQLVEAGKVKLTARLGTYLPDYPNREVATKVTIHQLLTHTGGTGDIFGPEFDAHRNELRTLADYVKLYGKRELRVRAGQPLGVQQLRVRSARRRDREGDRAELLRLRARARLRAGGDDEERIATREPSGSGPFDRIHEASRAATAWAPNTETLPYRGTSAGGGYSTVETSHGSRTRCCSHKLLSPTPRRLLIAGKIETGSRRQIRVRLLRMPETQAGTAGWAKGAAHRA